MKKEFVSRQQIKLLPERLRMAKETDAAKNLMFCIWSLFAKNDYMPMKIMIVGAGGSYPAAIFAKHILNDELHTPYIEAVTPQTAIRIFTQFDFITNCNYYPHYDLVIGISYSGKTPDIKFVSELCEEKGYPFILLTGVEKSKLSKKYKESDKLKIVSYFNSKDTTGMENGIISMFSTLAPTIIFDSDLDIHNALVEGKKFVSKLDITGIAKLIKQFPIIHVFYEWDTLPTAADIESKFVESGIANVILHEKKNFSHGRYISLYNQNFAAVINLTRYGMNILFGESFKINIFHKNEYDKNLNMFLRKICKDKSFHYIEMGLTSSTPAKWNIEAMCIIPYLITAIGEKLNIDISKPLCPFPKEAIELYNYEGKF